MPSGHNLTVFWDPPLYPSLVVLGATQVVFRNTSPWTTAVKKAATETRTPVWFALSKEKWTSKAIAGFPSNWKRTLHLGPYNNGLNWHVELSPFPLRSEPCLKVPGLRLDLSLAVLIWMWIQAYIHMQQTIAYCSYYISLWSNIWYAAVLDVTLGQCKTHFPLLMNI